MQPLLLHSLDAISGHAVHIQMVAQQCLRLQPVERLPNHGGCGRGGEGGGNETSYHGGNILCWLQ